MKKQKLLLAASGLTLSLLLTGAGAAVNPVVDAAARGASETVRQLLRGGADVNAAQGDGMTALHWAAERGDADLAKILIYAGGNVNAGTRIGHYTPLHIASRKGRVDVVRALLAANADAHATTSNSGVMPLHLAAASGNPDAVTALLDAGADINAREGAWGQTPLIFAAARNRVDVLDVLLEAGADSSIASIPVDVVDREKGDKASEKRLAGFLAEFKAKEGGGPNWQPSPNQVQAAIEASREIQRKWPDVPDPSCDDDAEEEAPAEDEAPKPNPCALAVTYNADGEPVYDYANDEEDENAPPRPPTYGQLVSSWGGLTPLLHAIRQGHTEASLVLLDGGADINQVSAGDQTSPLLMAAVNGQFDLALSLLEKGANPNLASAAGATPLFAVLERTWAPRASYAHPTEHQQQNANHIQVMEALLEAGADPNTRLNYHLWYMEYTFAVLRQAGIHYKGATPFWRASQALDVEAMRLLKDHGADPGVATIKLPARKRRTPPDEQEIKAADAKKAKTLAETDEDVGYETSEAEEKMAKDKEEKDHSGLEPVPVGGAFIFPIHAAAGAGYGQQYAGNAHRYAPDNWLPAVRFLVEECGADVNTRDANGYTALHHAASRGDNELVRYLVENGADVKVVSRKGQTTADMANGPIQRLSPFPETIDLLVGYGAVNNNNCVSC